MTFKLPLFLGALAGFALVGCGDDTTPHGGGGSGGAGGAPPVEWQCLLEEGSDPDSAPQLGCQGDYDILSSEPTDASIPGATSVKTIVDRADDETLYFQNSKRYCIHWDFAFSHLSGDGKPIVGDLSTFNSTEYYSPDRRFILGALSYYEGPAKWVYEISPYDTASAEMIATAFYKIRENVWMADDLSFHPTSVTVEGVAKDLPADIPITSTDELYDGVDYQPLNPGTSTGILRFHTSDEVDGTYTPYREVVVLDAVPNDISIVSGLITAQFQTPLAHINVLSVNRGTPNMALRNAQDNEELKALEGKWVELTVSPFDWKIKEITEAEADAWWNEHKPDPITVNPMNLAVTDLREASEMVDLETMNLKEAIATAIPVFGAKATNYGALARAQLDGAFADLPAEDGDGPVQPGFGVPMFYYNQFMTENGLYDLLDEMMADPEWGDPAYRAVALENFKSQLRLRPMRPEVVADIIARGAELFPGENLRFRSSTNSEDLGKFTGAGLYNSETGDPTIPGNATDSVEWAVKKVWSQVWNPRAFEEREFYSMNHLDVGMALLVHANFPQEEAQGVAITNNPFDTSGLEPAFFVNGQIGNNDVVTPAPGVLPDSYLHYFYSAGQPIVYIQHSTLVPEGETVIDEDQAYRLGIVLDGIHKYFYSAYGGAPGEFYALEVDWKFDDKLSPGFPRLYVKQARPYPGWKTETSVACTPK
jgi:hypothetical protein